MDLSVDGLFSPRPCMTSENRRVAPAPGQSTTVFHVPPQTVDEYGSFVGTSTVPGEWAQLNFVYGNPSVSANLSLTTWNPTDSSTYYQIGSEQFINNFYLQYNVPPLWGRVRLHALRRGYFYNIYGTVGQYGLGMYTNAIVGGVRGVGEDLVAEYDIGDKITVGAEDGIMGNRNGMGAINIVPSPQNGQSPIVWPSAWMHHFHLGFEKRGDLTWRARIHYLTNWTQDDRIQTGVDNPQTRQIDESYVKDGQIATYGADFSVASPILGYLGGAFSLHEGRQRVPRQGTRHVRRRRRVAHEPVVGAAQRRERPAHRRRRELQREHRAHRQLSRPLQRGWTGSRAERRLHLRRIVEQLPAVRCARPLQGRRRPSLHLPAVPRRGDPHRRCRAEFERHGGDLLCRRAEARVQEQLEQPRHDHAPLREMVLRGAHAP